MFDLLPFSRRSSSLPNTFSDMNELVKRLWVDFPFHNIREDVNVTWTPRLDVSENDDGLEIVADLPGMKKEDIHVSLEDNVLAIQGERKEEKESKEKQYHTVERWSGSFYRAVRLPVEVEKEKIDAHFKEGILTLRLPKSKEAKRKVAEIAIK